MALRVSSHHSDAMYRASRRGLAMFRCGFPGSFGTGRLRHRPGTLSCLFLLHSLQEASNRANSCRANPADYCFDHPDSGGRRWIGMRVPRPAAAPISRGECGPLSFRDRSNKSVSIIEDLATAAGALAHFFDRGLSEKEFGF